MSKFITEKFKNDFEGYGCVILPIPKQGEFWNIVKHSQIYKFSISAYSDNFLDGTPQQKQKKAFETVGSRKYTEIYESDIKPLRLEDTNQPLVEIVDMLENGVIEVKAYGIHNSNDNKNTLQFDSASDDNKHALIFTCPKFTYELTSDSDNIAEARKTIEKEVIPELLKLPNKNNKD